VAHLTFSRKLYPELKENLEQFRTHLKESAHEMAPLKVWQLQGTMYYLMMRLGSWKLENRHPLSIRAVID